MEPAALDRSLERAEAATTDGKATARAERYRTGAAWALSGATVPKLIDKLYMVLYRW